MKLKRRLITISIISLILIIQIILSINKFKQELKISKSTYLKNSTPFTKSNKIKKIIKYNYLEKYPFYLDCKNKQLKKWKLNSNQTFNYTKPVSDRIRRLRITRAVIFYFPFEKRLQFINEFKWLYRSWIEIQKSEPHKWRTDLIVFSNNSFQSFKELNCSFKNVRRSNFDKPMCTLIRYTPLKYRNYSLEISKYKNLFTYESLLNRLNIFSDNQTNLMPFYISISSALKNYSYTDSILMAFDGYNYFKKAKYDFLIRSDLDVFLGPLFSNWLPVNCNDFCVGRAGYSESFNRNRLRKASLYLGYEYGYRDNLGSTWYSTPYQFRLVSYLTLINMMYLTREEFTRPEVNGLIGTKNWPYWHYGVLLLYGQHMGLNHLIGANQSNVVHLNTMLDFPSSSTESKEFKIHIHVYHSQSIFSKFVFQKGGYNNVTLPTDAKSNKQTNYYCLKLALESRRLNGTKLSELLFQEIKKKV